MIKDAASVRRELRRRVLLGLNPSYCYESACDHDVDWTAISPEEFFEIHRGAVQERELRRTREGGTVDESEPAMAKPIPEMNMSFPEDRKAFLEAAMSAEEECIAVGGLAAGFGMLSGFPSPSPVSEQPTGELVSSTLSGRAAAALAIALASKAVAEAESPDLKTSAHAEFAGEIVERYAPKSFGYIEDVVPGGDRTHTDLFMHWSETFWTILLVKQKQSLLWEDEQLAAIMAFKTACPFSDQREQPFHDRPWVPPAEMIRADRLSEEMRSSLARYLIWPPGKRGLRLLPEWFDVKSEVLCTLKKAYIVRSGAVVTSPPPHIPSSSDMTQNERWALDQFVHDATRQALEASRWLRSVEQIPEVVYRMVDNPVRWSKETDREVLKALEWMRQESNRWKASEES